MPEIATLLSCIDACVFIALSNLSRWTVMCHVCLASRFFAFVVCFA